MQVVLATLLTIEAVLFAVAMGLGFVIDAPESALLHVNTGILAAVFTLFIHCLVMFYVIGSGKAIKEAVEEFPDLEASYLPFIRAQRRRIFPIGTFAILMVLIASFAGAWIHSEMLAVSPSAERFPVRSLPGWWLHLVLITIALGVNTAAFVRAARVVRDNVLAIQTVNRELAGRLAPPPGSPFAPPRDKR